MAQLPSASTLVEDVRREVRAAMAGGDQRIDEVARMLGMSGRTLQRRLAGDGLTYAAIVDEIRLEAAKIALADLSMSLSHVAYLVGFEEQSSFSRAFKR
jgi:AraC-like DNA-binding protein